MDSPGANGAEAALPPPPPIPPNVVPLHEDKEQVPDVENQVAKPKRELMARKGLARRGQPIQLLTNHFAVKVANTDGYFFHYSVALFYEDGRPVDGKGIGRRVLDRVHETYSSELDGKHFAYDGEKSLFTVGALPQNKHEFMVVLEEASSNRAAGNGSPDGNNSPNEVDRKRLRRPYRSKSFKVEISFAAKIPMNSIANALRGRESEDSQEALRVLDIVLRQHAAEKGCLLVRQSFFHNNPRNFTDLGGGVLGCKGFHSSFRATQGGLSLNIDVSTTMIVQPGPLLEFLVANQNVKDPYSIDWAKAKRTLKNLRIKAIPSNAEYKITGLSELPCNQQLFTLKQRGDADVEEITVYEYFVNRKGTELRYSAELPCINVGKAKRPTYIPIELCSLISLQRYTKALSTFQRSSLVEKSRQKPQERMAVLSDVLKTSMYDRDPMLKACGVSINSNFTQIEARVLATPMLKLGNGEDLKPQNGRWDFRFKKFVRPTKIECWAIANFSTPWDINSLVRDLVKCGEQLGIFMNQPLDIFHENPQTRRAPPSVRVEQMFEQMMGKIREPPQFLLCLMPERKTCTIYGPWKKKALAEVGIPSQCIGPNRKPNMAYYANVLLKINAKLGGLNSLLSVEHVPSIPLVSKIPTIILGMDVSHGSPGHSDTPSIAAVVSSRQWPLISSYRASVKTQPARSEMIASLFKPVEDRDEGLVRELLLDFYASSGKRKPEHIIIFRDGVSESQFNQVLNIELNQIIEACKFLDEKWSPKFTLIIAQKNHHTKFFMSGSPNNVPPGTVIDTKVCHPRNNDFYICSHAGMIGTTRPTHYHVLYDEIGFSADDLQELVHSLSYVYQRSTTAISVVAPIRYAHLAASQMGHFVKFEDASETSSSHGGMSNPGAVPVPELPTLKDSVSSSMFFC
ncbi:hypothetical protein Scep_024509 [Stephania cephalantha]|uniref:Argonaute 4 n=1 Tax=Stephania cephalantha TaxID=152367 RepID=A0AAP0F5N5_9MAGN